MPGEPGAPGAVAPDSRFTIRAYEPGDESAILELFARAFGVSRTVAHWRWEFEQNPLGARRISLAFDSDGRLVGQYAGYPVSFRDGDAGFMAHQIGDTMTDVSVRHVGRGPTSIFGQIAGHFYRTYCDGQVAFNYGFNVSNVQKFSMRFLRSDRVEPVPYRVRDLRADPIARIPRAARWLRGFQLELVTDPGEEWDRFFEQVAPAYRFLTRRDAQYIRWRYLEHPGRTCFIVAIRKWRRLAGWSVFRVREHRLIWGDALFDPRHPEAVEVLLRHIVPGYPVDALEAWFPKRPEWFDAILANLRLEVRTEPQDLALMCVPFAIPDATARMRERLYYTMGDSDLF
ncbi:MAG TPA: GNAT family N-acetyltransferase [Thermoanaerobaculia bacterium]|nr:GNAT family N-acetyltransferase [Thermoanaerobaculia bacterium]